MGCRAFPECPPPAASDWPTRSSVTVHPRLPPRGGNKVSSPRERPERKSSLPAAARRDETTLVPVGLCCFTVWPFEERRHVRERRGLEVILKKNNPKNPKWPWSSRYVKGPRGAAGAASIAAQFRLWAVHLLVTVVLVNIVFVKTSEQLYCARLLTGEVFWKVITRVGS